MKHDENETKYVSHIDEVFREVEKRNRGMSRQMRDSYLFHLGRVPVNLTNLEYRIMQFLSTRPYHAFTPKQIVEAVDTPTQPVTEETLREHIASLRDKLGVFSDYIQTVPYIGYRFKA